ncbi:MAG: 2-amino-4-hydroxy-6-hydroxymethyldihydropteridine diphosphokinase [Gemmatimonadetes bacterium]|nr:2-amino-4-hydroxy-6-hydroxymethyldihydropteridine diphosphokinase [Gemmatimonadota bacterium]
MTGSAGLEPGACRAALSLGSNLGDRAEHLAAARASLGRDPRIDVLSAGLPRLTAPQGIPDQPEFLNQVVLVRTTLSPWDLLDRCLSAERERGRQRGPVRWGPRTLDVDILAYEGLVICDERLQVPHSALPLRPFFRDMLADLGAEDLLP